MLKLKFFDDAEFEIIDIVPVGYSHLMNGDPTITTVGMYICKNDLNDATFEVVSMGDLEYRKSLLQNKEQLIGKKVTVKFYERSGVSQVPFHANALIIRDYE